MGINSRHNSHVGRRQQPTIKIQPTSKLNKDKYYDDKVKRPFNIKFWVIIIILIGCCYIFLKQIESYLIEEVYLINKEYIPKADIKLVSDENVDKLIKDYQMEDKLPYYDDEIAVILFVLDSYNGKHRTKTNQIKSIVKSELTQMDKLIKKKYYIIEIDNTTLMEDNKYKQEMPWNWLLDYKIRSILDYGLLPNSINYVDINKFVKKIRDKYKNAIVSVNIGTVIDDSIFAYESLMDIGRLSNDNVIVTVSPGKYQDANGITNKLKDFKYYTMQRIAFRLLDEKIINPKNFKIALNADSISTAVKDNPELYNEFLNMKVRGRLSGKILEKKFIEKWVKKYPEMFYSEQSPIEYFNKNADIFDKEYEKDSQLANPKVNLSKTQEELKTKIVNEKNKY